MGTALKFEVKKALYKKVLQKSPFLSKLDDDVIDKLCSKVVSQTFVPGDIVLTARQISTELIFVLDGTINILLELPNDKTEYLKSFNSGEIIDEGSFVLQEYIKYNAYARTFCKVAKLNYEDLMTVLKEDPQSIEKIHVLNDNLRFN